VLNANDNSYFTGNVGIGTTSPTSPLTIKSNSTSSSSSGLTIQSNGNTNNIFELAEKSTDGARLQMYDAGVAKIALYTDGTDNYINAGNVGIGTVGPEGKLNIETSAESGVPALGANTTFLKISNTGGAYGAMIGQLGTGNSYIQSQRFDGTATAYNLLLQPNGGNVGIGTSTPFSYSQLQMILAEAYLQYRIYQVYQYLMLILAVYLILMATSVSERLRLVKNLK
jgi:hypothetical protein